MSMTKPKLNIDVDGLVKSIREHQRMIIIVNNIYIRSIRDPSDEQHIALNAQLQVASEGKHPTYILWIGEKDRANLDFLLEILEGADLKLIAFINKDDKEDMEKAAVLMQILSGPMTIGKVSKDFEIK
jgi:hypothetical protein